MSERTRFSLHNASLLVWRMYFVVHARCLGHFQIAQRKTMLAVTAEEQMLGTGFLLILVQTRPDRFVR